MRADGGEPTGTGGGRGARLFSAVLAVFGMPDYAAHCRHVREQHPGSPLPTEREFFDEFVRARYGDGPTRCC